MRKFVRLWRLLACLIAVAIFPFTPSAFAEDGQRMWDSFSQDIVTSSSYDDDADGYVDENVATWRVTNTDTSACYVDVEFVHCGHVSRRIADLGCAYTPPYCDFEACGYNEFNALYPECEDTPFIEIQVWSLCANPELVSDSVTTGGFPLNLGDFGPGEAKDFQITFYGDDNLVPIVFATEVVHDYKDTDCDGVHNGLDNCSGDYNPDQVDTDLDGYGEVCDCDDTDPAINPEAIESIAIGNCQDQKDNDCDGLIDAEDPDCKPPCAPNIVPVSSSPSAICLIPLVAIVLIGTRIFRRK